MKVLIVYAHSEDKSFVASMKNTCIDILKSKGCLIKISNLYEMKYQYPLGKNDFTSLTNQEYFKPQQEQGASNKANFEKYSEQTKEEHLKLQWANLVLFIFPLYWFHMPGATKNWVDRNFSMGFAYGNGKILDDGPLKGKKAMCIFATGAPSEMLNGFGLKYSSLYLMNISIFKFCGMTPLEPFIAYSAAHVGDEQRKKYIAELTAIMGSIESREVFNSEKVPKEMTQAPSTKI